MSDTQTFSVPFDRLEDAAADPTRLKQLEFHITSGDYFPVLATMLAFLEDGAKLNQTGMAPDAVPLETKLIEDFRKDLIYLHKHYRIVRKDQ